MKYLHNEHMKSLGKRSINLPGPAPTAAGLAAARVHQATGAALAAMVTTGIAKGVYRFSSHAEMNEHTELAQARAVVENARLRRGVR